MIAERVLNPNALNHLPCTGCGKSADECNREPLLPGGSVQYLIQGKGLGSTAWIAGRKCTACTKRELNERGAVLGT